MVHSKDMEFPKSFTSVFINNQFKTKIEIPQRPKFPSLKDKVAIVTGANTGLGFEAARQLLTLGLSHLIVAVRSVEKGKTAAATLRQTNSSATIEVWPLDMASYESIQAFVKRVDRELPRIDITLLNAGMSGGVNFTAAKTGHEIAVQVNHLSTALLTTLLLPVLRTRATKEEPAHLTIVNSIMSHLCKYTNRDERPVLAALDNPKKYDAQDRYGVSKLLNQLFLVELTTRIALDTVIVSMVDPGLTKGTGLFKEVKGVGRLFMGPFLGIAGRPVDQGAATYVHATVRQGRDSHGCFLMNGEIAPLAAINHTPEGKALSQQVWKETMNELSFAAVGDIIASLE